MTHAVLIPCTGPKLAHSAPAVELYTGTTFAPALKAAKSVAGSGAVVLIVSAKHGLLDLDQQVSPYNVTMGDAEAVEADTVAAQLADHGITSITALLPKAYLRVITEAAGTAVPVTNLYAGCRGIGDQRGVCRRLAEVPA